MNQRKGRQNTLEMTGAKKILTTSKPEQLSALFHKSNRSNRLILPKFNSEKCKTNSFIFNSSKIVNFVLSSKIDIYNMSQSTLKVNLKRFLMTKQSATLHGDPNWYPCNLSIFSDVNL